MIRSTEGTCGCGCGRATATATKTDRSKGWVKGQPLRYVLGHNARVTNRPRRTSVGPDDWAIENRGYATPCWVWKGKGCVSGDADYRRVGIDGHYESAHAAVYRRLVGPIPPSHELHHLCEIRACVRPEHLHPITKSEHIAIHKRKLPWCDVSAIREDSRLLREVAADYGVSTTTVSDIRLGKTRVAA